ncbi:MAG TPA: hypothetical protein VGH38_10485 [Bryobacteraceae bacterium]|jgi:hypothetical protein
MTKKLLIVTTVLLVVALGVFAADVTGKWTYEMAGRQGGTPRPVTLNLKADGSKLTGTVSGMMGRGGGGGGTPPEMEIQNGKVDGSNVSFETKMEFNGNTRVTKYEGTLSGDELKLKVTRDTQNGPQTNEVTAKRSGT